MVDSRTAPEVGNRDHRRRSAPRRDRRYRPARLPRRLDGTTRDARPSDCRCSIPTSATTKFVDEQGEGASPAGACVSRPAASAAAATPTAHAAGIAARVPTRIRLRARPPRGGSPGVRPRPRRSCPTIPAPPGRGPPPAAGEIPSPQVDGTPAYPTQGSRDIVLEVDDATPSTETFTHLRTGKPCRDRIGLLDGAARRGNQGEPSPDCRPSGVDFLGGPTACHPLSFDTICRREDHRHP